MHRILAGLVCAMLMLNALGCSNSNVHASAAPPPAVEVAPVIQKDVPVQGEWVGTLEGYVNAQISPQVSGYLIRQDYHEGAFVKKGQVYLKSIPVHFKRCLIRPEGIGTGRSADGERRTQRKASSLH